MTDAVFYGIVGTLLGAITGSSLTFLFGLIATKRNDLRKAKMNVFVVLMGRRTKIASQEVADFVNTIPIIFARDYAVRKAYQHFIASLGQAAPEDIIRRYNELVIEIGKNLGFSGSINEADLSTGFMIFTNEPSTPNKEVSNLSQQKNEP